MKKLVIAMMIYCFTLTILAATPKPVLAADGDSMPVVIGVSVGAVIAVILVLAATGSDNEIQAITEKYQSRMYKWTYDEMLAEKGKPSLVNESKDTILAQYYNASAVNVGNTVYHKASFLTEASSDTESRNVMRFYGEKCSFYFDKNKKTLKGWQYIDMNNDGTTPRISTYGGNLGFVPDAGANAAVAAPKAAAAAAAPPASADTSGAAKSLEQKLKELKDLNDKKLITNEEYKKSREKLLENAVK